MPNKADTRAHSANWIDLSAAGSQERNYCLLERTRVALASNFFHNCVV